MFTEDSSLGTRGLLGPVPLQPSVLCCGVLWGAVLRCGVVWCGVAWCGVVCRRRCYQKAMAGMSTDGYRSTGGLCVWRARRA